MSDYSFALIKVSALFKVNFGPNVQFKCFLRTSYPKLGCVTSRL